MISTQSSAALISARRSLHLAYTLQCVGDRTWQFLLPLLLTESFPGPGAMVATAALGLLRQGTSTLCSAPFSAMVGAGDERTFKRLTVVENLTMLCGALLLLHHSAFPPTAEDPLSTARFWGPAVLLSADAICSDLLVQWLSKTWMARLCALSPAKCNEDDASKALSSLSSPSSSSSSSSSSSDQLAVANAVTRRLDLGVALAAPLLVGCSLHFCSSRLVVAVLAVWHLVGCTAMCAAVRRAFAFAPALHAYTSNNKDDDDDDDAESTPKQPQHQKKKKNTSTKKLEPASSLGPRAFVSEVADAFRNFDAAALRNQPLPHQQQQVLPWLLPAVMGAYVSLYLTVLSPGGLLVAWLRGGPAQLSPAAIGAFRAAMQLAGLAGTVAAPFAINRLGLLRALGASQLFQCACVLAASQLFWRIENLAPAAAAAAAAAATGTTGTTALSSPPGATSLGSSAPLCFLAALCCSRVGLWGVDLSELQILQTGFSSTTSSSSSSSSSRRGLRSSGSGSEDGSKRLNVVLGVQGSLASGADLVMSLLSLSGVPFPALVGVSVAAVSAATGLVVTAVAVTAVAIAGVGGLARSADGDGGARTMMAKKEA
jgi:hypothetical protein